MLTTASLSNIWEQNDSGLLVFHSPMSFEGITQQGYAKLMAVTLTKSCFPSALFGYACKNSAVQFFMEGKKHS